MKADAGRIVSPNYPGTPYIGHDQWDENAKCYWNIAPKSSVSGIFLTVRHFFLGRRDQGNRCKCVHSISVKALHNANFGGLRRLHRIAILSSNSLSP